MTDADPAVLASGRRSFAAALMRQFMQFAAVGLVGTAVHYSLLILLAEAFGVDPVIGSFLGFISGGLVNYYLNYKITFRSTKRHQTAMAQFFTVVGIGLGLNTLLMALFVNQFGVQYLIAQIVTTGLVLIWHFLGNRFWTFR